MVLGTSNASASNRRPLYQHGWACHLKSAADGCSVAYRMVIPRRIGCTQDNQINMAKASKIGLISSLKTPGTEELQESHFSTFGINGQFAV